MVEGRPTSITLAKERKPLATFLGGPQPPYLAGFEAAGEIVASGEAVTGLEPGARVIGVGIGCGAFAEYVAVPAAAVMPVRAGWAEKEALGLIVNWPTALAALRPLGRLAAGQTVLIRPARPARRGQPSPASDGNLTPQHCDLMPQHKDLHVLGGITARQEHQPAKHPDHEQVDKTD